MRLLPVWLSIFILPISGAISVSAEPAQAPPDTTPAAATAPTERIPHPVVYLDEKPETAASTGATAERIPHPVVYDTEPTKQEPEQAAAEPARQPTAEQSPEALDEEAEPAVLPPNPDLDASDSDEVAKPAPAAEPATPTVTQAPAQPTSPAAEALAELIETKSVVQLDEAEWAAVSNVYGGRNFAPIWTAETGVTQTGRKLTAALMSADQWGLNPSQFETPDVADAANSSETMQPETRAKLELELTAAALRYASHARGGRILNPTEQLSSYLDRKPQLKDPQLVLTDLAAASDPSAVLHALHPKHPQFEKLRQKYLELKSAAARPEFVRIPRGSLLRLGMTHPHVALLRERLKIAEIPPEDGSSFDPEVFDDHVLDAVKTYQSESGLRVDGLVGNGTRRALNDVALPDPQKLLVNMEQWRWMPDDMGDTYVWVNVPEYKVRFIRDGEVVHEERIIIGKFNQQTPVFSDVVETLYFHPKWHVPESIKVRELYPSLARGGGYFRRQNLRIAYNGRPINPYNMNWSNRDIRRYHVYQPPGPGNVLGVVKFTFPNKHMVYLHDTPTKHLFNAKQRMYSHGCIRVRNPVRLAELIVEHANGMSTTDVTRILKGPLQETPVKLDNKMPVHITYFTAWVDEDGNEQAAKDIYGHEKRMKLALAGRFDQIAVGPDHLAPVKYTPQAQQYGTTALEDFFSNLFSGF